VAVLLILMLLTLLGAAALQLGQVELEQGRLQAQQLRVVYLAESGIELAMGSFAHPDVFDGGRREPDGAITLPVAALVSDASLLAGGTVEVRISAPRSHGAEATLFSLARTAGGLQRGIETEVMKVPVPTLTAATGSGDAGRSSVWSYEVLKPLARRYGRYYTSDRDGRLYRDGMGDPLTPDQLFTDEAAGGRSPVIFIDTLDARPPRSTPNDNRPVILFSGARAASAGHRFIYVAGHLVFAPSPASSEGAPVVQFDGGFYAAGRVQVERESRLFGAVWAAEDFDGLERLSVSYDPRLGEGVVPGWPVVTPVAGSWRWVTLY
jgi:hypothetical protein